MVTENKIKISLIVFFLLNIFLILFLIYPFYRDIKVTSEELIYQKEKLLLLEDKFKNIEEFKDNRPKMKTNLEKIETLFVDAKEPVEFINFLEETSRDSDISMKISSAQSKEKNKDPWTSLFFPIVLTGPFPKFLKLLEKLESSKYLIEAQNLKITRLTEAELQSKELEKFSLGDIRVDFLLKVFTK